MARDRDDFKAPVIRLLRDRVAQRCSNPDCRVPTSSGAGAGGVNNIGTAAHICAAAKGGPRYKASMTKEERGSIDNGIWLCTNCSRDIDNDVERYPEALLHEWKRRAEEAARRELGKPLPSDEDAVNLLSTALYQAPQRNALSRAIENTHTASNNALAMLDERFAVSSEYIDGVTAFKLNPKAPVKVGFTVKGAQAREFSEKYQELIEKGKGFEFSTEGMSAEGSKLISEVIKESTQLKISPPALPAIQKLSLIQKSTGILHPLDDVIGSISIGKKSFSFSGSSCKGVIKVQYDFPLVRELEAAKMKVFADLKVWEGLDINSLPFFDKIKDIFVKMQEGWDLITTLEIDGNEVFRSKEMRFDDKDYVLDMASFLYYTELCRKIAKEFRQNITFSVEVSYSKEEYETLAALVADIEKKEGYSREEIKNNTRCEMVITNPDDAQEFLSGKKAEVVRFISTEADKIKLFGTLVDLPPLTIEQGPVFIRVEGDCDTLKAGDSFSVELVPAENYRCYFHYQSQ